jgi:large subunit ribosomal protein L6
MSRISSKKIDIPSGVAVLIDDNFLTATGPKGRNIVKIPEFLRIDREKDVLHVLLKDTEADKNSRRDRKLNKSALHGTIRQHIFNAIKGVHQGFQKTLLLQGTSYTKSKNLGYSFVVTQNVVVIDVKKKLRPSYTIPEGVTVTKEDVLEPKSKTKIQSLIIKGFNIESVTQFAANILRKTIKWNPYTQQGIRDIDNKFTLLKIMNKKGEKK